MNLYPAIRARMGTWNYYIVKMRMKELASAVRFASEIYEDKTLDEAIQRSLNEGRVKKEIVKYLKGTDDRFFSSVVVAALGGRPTFFPIELSDDPRFSLFSEFEDHFGVLRFDGSQKYYALDGQHRLKSIKTILDPGDELSVNAPHGFEDEEISVIVVLHHPDKSERDFRQSYRRLFSNLNRYAKPTDRDTNIIMDEDDAVAIVTRRLISEHSFFRYEGRQKESPRVKTKGKGLKSGEPFFTSLQALYGMNETLLTTSVRDNSGWGPEGEDLKAFKRFRPDEDFLDELFRELVIYWDALLKELPVLTADPTQMRNHDTDHYQDQSGASSDNLLFWPVGQEMLARLVRRMLNWRLEGEPSRVAVGQALAGLGGMEWRLHAPPWRYLVLTEREDTWRMRSEERKEALKTAEEIMFWLLGVREYDSQGVESLKIRWASQLIPAQKQDDEDTMWSQVEKLKLTPV